MREIIFILVALLLVANVADYYNYCEVDSLPIVGEYLDLENHIKLYYGVQEGITLPRYSGEDIWGDIDGDGVMNVYDCCWTEPTNWLGVVFGTGCPDKDYDTIADYWDACPNTAGVSGSFADPLGCPPPAPVIPVTPATPATPTTPVSNNDTNTSDANATVASGNPPVAIFTVSINGAKITVDAKSTTSDNNVTAYLWNFGDGSISTKVSDTYTYTQSGTYYITLTVVDNRGLIDMETKTVEITAPATSTTGNNWLGLILFLGIVAVFVYLAFFNKGGKGKGKGSFLGKAVKTPKLRSEPKQKPILVKEHYRKQKNSGGLL